MVRQGASRSNRVWTEIALHGVMKELLSNIQFAKPLFLWLLLGLPLLWLRIRDQRLLVILGRTVILLLLIFGLADPQWAIQTGQGRRANFRL